MRILIVDDDAPTRDLLLRSCSRAGYMAVAAQDCREAKAAVMADRFGLVVLDVMLPDGSGIELCRALRADGTSMPILLLTARGAVGDRVAGLNAGADDYMSKPFAVSEFLARTRALCRRGPVLRDEIVRIGSCSIDFAARCMQVEGQRVLLTTQELAILEILASRRSRVVTRDDLVESIWGVNTPAVSNSLEVLIARIRRKLGDNAPLLRTARGIGYALGDT